MLRSEEAGRARLPRIVAASHHADGPLPAGRGEGLGPAAWNGWVQEGMRGRRSMLPAALQPWQALCRGCRLPECVHLSQGARHPGWPACRCTPPGPFRRQGHPSPRSRPRPGPPPSFGNPDKRSPGGGCRVVRPYPIRRRCAETAVGLSSPVVTHRKPLIKAVNDSFHHVSSFFIPPHWRQ